MNAEQRDGIFTLGIIVALFGISLGLNFGLWQVCKSKDTTASLLLYQQKMMTQQQKPKTETPPKNLVPITNLK